jgi:hypothetical protein
MPRMQYEAHHGVGYHSTKENQMSGEIQNTGDIMNAQGKMTKEAPHVGPGSRGKEQTPSEISLTQ